MAWNTSGDESALVYSTGLKSSVELPWRDFTFTLGNALRRDGGKVSGEERNDFTSIAIGLDAFYPLGMALRGRETHIGGWIGYYYYLDDLAFERAGMEPLRVDHEFEIAVTFGTYTPIPFGFLKLKRVGIAYRFNGDLKVYRLVFGSPATTAIYWKGRRCCRFSAKRSGGRQTSCRMAGGKESAAGRRWSGPRN
jgi:hypothetical protein